MSETPLRNINKTLTEEDGGGGLHNWLLHLSPSTCLPESLPSLSAVPHWLLGAPQVLCHLSGLSAFTWIVFTWNGPCPFPSLW